MASIAVTEIRREIIRCASHREAFAVCKFLVDYLDVHGHNDRLTVAVVAPSGGSRDWYVNLVLYKPFEPLISLIPAGDLSHNHE